MKSKEFKSYIKHKFQNRNMGLVGIGIGLIIGILIYFAIFSLIAYMIQPQIFLTLMGPFDIFLVALYNILGFWYLLVISLGIGALIGFFLIPI